MASPEDPDELIVLADGMLAEPRAATDTDFRIAALEARATGRRESRTGSPREHLVAALRDYEEILGLTGHNDPAWSARALNVAAANGEQIGVDTRAAARSAAALLRRALVRTNGPRLVAIASMNLALALMRSDDGPDALREARELCYRALD